ncbi:MAG: bifunctional DNA-binding transcriptional regulator/O6-methylguanine-DNA methyltransferase Ada [Dehalococcoidia bacterium]
MPTVRVRPATQTGEAMPNDEAMWQAVLNRSGVSDGAFVYAVSSTGIYCRPSCPARRPKRAHVRFFAAAVQAEQSGYRACRRCQPAQAESPAKKIVRQVCIYIDEHTGAPPNLATLGALVGLSPAHLQRLFKKTVGTTPRQYAAARRLDRFKSQVKDGNNVADAQYEAGYQSSSQLYSEAPARLGMTPAAYSRGGLAADISFATTTTYLGDLLVAATQRGICAIRFGPSPADLEQTLRVEFPAATIRRDDSSLRPWVDALLNHLEGQGETLLDLPMDIQATAFQARVYEALRAIPYGSTRSYRQIAESLGQPTAARSVASACARNPVALVIPCHRVVRGDGSLSGYRWGLDRKRSLLANEAKSANPGAIQNG